MLGTLSELGFSLIPWHPAATSLSRWARHMQDVMVTSKDAWWKSADDTRECRTGQESLCTSIAGWSSHARVESRHMARPNVCAGSVGDVIQR